MPEKPEDSITALMADVPRGVTTRHLREQTLPQSRWMDPARIAASEALRYDPDNSGGKILVGALGPHLIGIEDNRHVLTVAGSRAGKSVTIIGNLLFYRGSVLCLDPKGELANITAARRAALGQKVFVLDPFEVVKGKAAGFRAAYNPLATLRLGSRSVIEDAVQVADALVVRTGQEKDPHWNESAGNFLIGLILYVALCDDLPEAERHLGSVRALVNQALSLIAGTKTYALPKRILVAADRLAAAGHEDDAAAIAGSIRGFYEKGHDELASVLSTVHRHTQFLDFRAMKGVLTGHSFDLTDLKTAPGGVSVYLCLPATRMEMCNRWLRLFINQLLDAMEREQTRPAVDVLVCLDEFPVLGFMSQLQAAAGQIASFGVKLWVVLQDWGQGKALYGERFESFAANAGVFQAFGNVDVTTTEYISKRLDKTVVEVVRQTEVSPDQREKGVGGLSRSAELHDLLTPGEVSRLFARSDPQQRQLILWAGKFPMILQRSAYFDERSPVYGCFAGTFDSLQR